MQLVVTGRNQGHKLLTSQLKSKSVSISQGSSRKTP